MTAQRQVGSILGAGTILLDFLALVDESFLNEHVPGAKGGSDTVNAEQSRQLLKSLKEAQIEVKRVPGGSAPNTLRALEYWGVPVRLLGMIGHDEEGEFCRATFRDTSAVKYHDSLATGRCISFVTPDSERTMRTFLGASDKMRPQEITEQDLDGIALMLFEGYLLYNEALTLHLFDLAQRCHVPIAMDLASFELVGKYKNTLLPQLMKCAEIIFANREEATAFSGAAASDEELLEKLAAYADTVVLKLGAEGALIRTGKQVIPIQAEPCRALDTTGAGDLWQAGFLFGFLHGLPLDICGRFAGLSAARAVATLGACLSEQDLNELKQIFTGELNNE